MKQFILIVIIIFSLSNSFSQSEGKILPKRVISLETGVWSSGLVGLGYCRNFKLNEKIHFSTDLSAGLGVNWWNVNYLFNLCPMINFQKKNMILMVGLQARYFIGSLHEFDWLWWGPIPYPSKYNLSLNDYDGFTASPVIGIAKYYDTGFCYRLKLSALLPFRNGGIDQFRPSIGMSFGYAF